MATRERCLKAWTYSWKRSSEVPVAIVSWKVLKSYPLKKILSVHEDVSTRRCHGSSVGRASFQRSLKEVPPSDWRGFMSWQQHKVVGKILAVPSMGEHGNKYAVWEVEWKKEGVYKFGIRTHHQQCFNVSVLTDESRILSTTTMDSMGRFETTSPTLSATTPSELADLEKTITNLLPSQDTITSLVASSNRASASFLRKHYTQVCIFLLCSI